MTKTTPIPTPSSTPVGTATQQPTDTAAAEKFVVPDAPLFLRVNQIGYLPEDTKTAFVLTNANLSGYPFDVFDKAGDSVFTGKVGEDLGEYGHFAHVYTLDFSHLTKAGSYTVKTAGTLSPPFEISRHTYAGLISLSLEFFRIQRCGDTDPAIHQPCHLSDARVANGPFKGEHIDTSGGWHDAGDYIKFMLTTGYSLNLMLTAYQHHPQAFEGTQFLKEMRVALDWTMKMWDSENHILYYQVGDESDHDNWRMPEYDDKFRRARPVFAAPEGHGANVAGKAASALAIASMIWGNEENPLYDSALAGNYLQAARELYDFGKSNPEAQPSNPADFYTEKTWRDDMALAGAELFRATGEKHYLEEAQAYAKEAGNGKTINWANLHGLAHYEIARLDPAYVPTAAKFLLADLEPAESTLDGNPFALAFPKLHWGIFEDMLGYSLEALWYEDLTGDTRFHPLMIAQRDYILGRNPWGVCFVGGAGTVFPQHPHHQIADIKNITLTGFWDEGPVPLPLFEDQGIHISGDDPFADFQTEEAVFHDNTEDYVTNEPTITMNAAGVAFTSWFNR